MLFGGTVHYLMGTIINGYLFLACSKFKLILCLHIMEGMELV